MWVYQCKERTVAIRLGRGVAGHGVDKTANGAWVGRWEGERELPIPRTQTKIKSRQRTKGKVAGIDRRSTVGSGRTVLINIINDA